jgi:hypothetical protein
MHEWNLKCTGQINIKIGFGLDSVQQHGTSHCTWPRYSIRLDHLFRPIQKAESENVEAKERLLASLAQRRKLESLLGCALCEEGTVSASRRDRQARVEGKAKQHQPESVIFSRPHVLRMDLIGSITGCSRI